VDRFLHHVEELLLLVALAQVLQDESTSSLLLQFEYVALWVTDHLDRVLDLSEADHVDDDVSFSILKSFLNDSAASSIISVGACFPLKLRHLDVQGSCLE